MVDYIGQRAAEKIGRLAGLSEEDREIVAYGLEYLLAGLIGLILIISISLVFGLLKETLAVICCWGLLRIFAGGAHCTALWRCTVASLIGILVAVLLARIVSYFITPLIWIVFCIICTFVAIYLWAPNNSERPVADPMKRKLMRKRALVVLSIVSLFLLYLIFSSIELFQQLAMAGATGFVTGALLLSPLGLKAIKWCDLKMVVLHQAICHNCKDVL